MDKINAHKFKVGETISYRSSSRGLSARPGPYRVVGHRPPEDGEPSYRIKSELESHERIARESELTGHEKWQPPAAGH